MALSQPAGMKNNAGAALQVAAWDWAGATNVAYTGSSAATGSALTPGLYLLVATTICHLAQGSSPTAATSDGILPAGVPVPWLNTESQKLAAIQSADAGTLSIIPAL